MKKCRSYDSAIKTEFLTKLSGVSTGEARTPVLTKAIGMLNSLGVDSELALGFASGCNRLNEDPLPDDKLIYTVTDLYNRYKNESISEKTL